METLAGAALRSLVLAAAAWAVMAVVRVKSPAARHAVWTLVTAGMLALAITGALLPTMPVRVLPPRAQPAIVAGRAPVSPDPRPLSPFPWKGIYAAGCITFAARMAYGFLLARKLVRASRLVEPGIYESARISVPLTTGWLHPKILLPAGWRAWTPDKLQTVLVHERNHIRRADWAIAVLAGANRCVFWFHPLAWWLESRLKTLAEFACDDASFPHAASRECYAQVLIEMAAAIRPGEGRVGWEGMAMAKTAEVRMRVERILDESRQVFPALTRRRWAVMVLCAVPVVYLAAVARPARVRAQQPPPAPRYFVQGEIRQPGEYKMTTPTTVLKALVIAGGFRESANTSDIVILREEDGVSKRLKFNYNEIARGENLEQNIFLKSGDIIVVR